MIAQSPASCAHADPDTTAVPVLFAIPYDAQETSAEARVAWQLEVKARTPGVDYHAAFKVPVLKTPESRPDFIPDESPIAAYLAPVDADSALRAAGIIRQPSPDGRGHRYEFPLLRHPGVALVILLFTAAWSGMIAAMWWWFEAPWVIDILLMIFFGLFDILFVIITLDLWLYRSVVDASPLGLAVRGGWLGLGRTVQVPRDDIIELKLKSNMSMGHKVYYDVLAARRGARSSRWDAGSSASAALKPCVTPWLPRSHCPSQPPSETLLPAMRARSILIGLILAAAAAIFFARPWLGESHHAAVPRGPYHRIVSLAPSVTETVFALGLGDRVVGVSRFCRFPPEVEKLPNVGGMLDPNIEAIVALEPDLVLMLIEHEQSLPALEKMGLNCLSVNHQNIEGILASLNTIGQVCDAQPAAERLRTTSSAACAR